MRWHELGVNPFYTDRKSWTRLQNCTASNNGIAGEEFRYNGKKYIASASSQKNVFATTGEKFLRKECTYGYPIMRPLDDIVKDLRKLYPNNKIVIKHPMKWEWLQDDCDYSIYMDGELKWTVPANY